jgi:hypothetical protein
MTAQPWLRPLLLRRPTRVRLTGIASWLGPHENGATNRFTSNDVWTSSSQHWDRDTTMTSIEIHDGDAERAREAWPGTVARQWFLIPAAFVYGVFGAFRLAEHRLDPLGWLCLLAGLFFVGLFFRPRSKRELRFVVPSAFTVDADGVSLAIPRSDLSGHYRWSAIRRVVPVDDFLFIDLMCGAYVAIPQRALTEGASALEAELRRRLAAAREERQRR